MHIKTMPHRRWRAHTNRVLKPVQREMDSELSCASTKALKTIIHGWYSLTQLIELLELSEIDTSTNL